MMQEEKKTLMLPRHGGAPRHLGQMGVGHSYRKPLAKWYHLILEWYLQGPILVPVNVSVS